MNLVRVQRVQSPAVTNTTTPVAGLPIHGQERRVPPLHAWLPKRRDDRKAVRYAVFAYGEGRAEARPADVRPHSPIPDLPTDVTFPDLSADVPAEVRRTIARVHINLGPGAPDLRRACEACVPSRKSIYSVHLRRPQA